VNVGWFEWLWRYVWEVIWSAFGDQMPPWM
jgi:hypothetical protein